MVVALTRPAIRRRWTRGQYDSLLDAGLLGPEDKAEFIDAQVVYKLDYCPFARTAYEATGVLPRRLWTREEQAEMVQLGILSPGERVELAPGDALPIMSQKGPHPTSILLCAAVLRRIFEPDCHVREEKPITLSEVNEPEPDIAVASGQPRDYRNGHPTTALLLVEVSDSSLEIDRTYKASMFARYGILDYWIVNLVERQLEVFRRPAPNPAEPFGYGYQDIQVIPADGVVSPMAKPDENAVADLLP